MDANRQVFGHVAGLNRVADSLLQSLEKGEMQNKAKLSQISSCQTAKATLQEQAILFSGCRVHPSGAAVLFSGQEGAKITVQTHCMHGSSHRLLT